MRRRATTREPGESAWKERGGAVAAVLVLQAVAGLALGLPGHLSVDSVVQLYDDAGNFNRTAQTQN